MSSSRHLPGPSPASVTCGALSYAWPDGSVVLDGLQTSFGPGRTGLTGVNGSGKSTLLKLISGELTPSDGAVRVRGEVGLLPQNVTLDTASRVDEALGVTATRRALHAIEAGDVREEHFAAVGDDWDVEERALAHMASADQLISALDAYEGALLVASHDLPFLAAIGVSRRLRLGTGPQVTVA